MTKQINYFQSISEHLLQVMQYKRLRKESHDVLIPPYISTDITINSNWAKDYLKHSVYLASQPVYKRKAVVFILDTAGQITHEDVAPRVANEFGKDFTGEGKEDGNGHGTGCASCYVGEFNGVAPMEDTIIVPVKVLRNNGSGSYTQVLNGMKYAYDTWKTHFPGWIGVISMSLGGGSPYTPMDDFSMQARQAGMWIAASSGNSGFVEHENRVGYPAKYPAVWAIGAIDSEGKIASFSSAGDELVFAGPGKNVQIAWKDNSYINANGTSFGMPYTMAALLHMACQYPALNTMQKAEEYYAKYTTDLHSKGKDKATGHGCPILSEFIGQIPDQTPEPPPDPTPAPEPPQETPPPTDTPRKNTRTLHFSYESQRWYMNWQQQRYPGNHRLFVKKVDLVYTSKDLAPAAHDKILKDLDAFFKNRGIILAIDRESKTDAQLKKLITHPSAKLKAPEVLFLPFAGSVEPKDYADAAYWTGRFIEVVFRTSSKLQVKVKTLHATDEKGRSVKIEY